MNIARPTHSTVFTMLFITAAAASSGCARDPGAEQAAELDEPEATAESEQALFSGTEVRSGVAANRCLDVAGGVVANGTKVQIHACNGTNAQKWLLTADGRLRSGLNSSYCLDVKGAGTSPGTVVQLYACNGTNAQKWTVTSKGELRSAVALNRCLDVAGAGTSNGTQVQIYTCNGTVAQQWFEIPDLPVSDDGDLPITIHDVKLDGLGNSLVRVAPGQVISATIHYTIYQAGYCPSCIDQILIGFPEAPQGCAYSAIPSASGTSGSKTLSITAPSTPGVHYLRFRGAMSYSCDLADWFEEVPGEANDIAVISVE